MSTVSSSNIAELRARTGAGVVECKKALTESSGDINKAIELLRQRGIATAAKKSGKIAAEGAVIAKVSPSEDVGVLIELNSQTDFVAKNEKFQSLLHEILDVAIQARPADLDALQKCKLNSGDTVADGLIQRTSEIGEKLDLRRFELIMAAPGQRVCCYTHPIGSKIAVLLKLECNQSSDVLGKDLCMHIAAVQPQPEFISRDEIPSNVIAEETRIEQGKEDLVNKPPEIRDKIVQGRVEKALLEKVLLEQPFIKDPSRKIKDLVAEQNAKILQFARFNLGEGIERGPEQSFADEVAAQMKGS